MKEVKLGPALRAQVLAQRGTKEKHHATPNFGSLRDVEKEIKSRCKDWIGWLERGQPKSTPKLAPFLPRLMDAFADSSTPLDVDVEGVRRLICGSDCVAWWLLREGPAFAIEALCAALPWDSDTNWKDKSYTVTWSSSYVTELGTLSSNTMELDQLRTYLALAADDVYAKVLSVAKRLWSGKNASAGTRIVLAYLFPTEPGWGDEAAEAALVAREKLGTKYVEFPVDARLLLASIESPATGVRIGLLGSSHVREETFATLLYRLGERAAPITAACAQVAIDGGTKSPLRDKRKMFVRMHLLIQTEEAFRLAAPWLDDKTAGPIVLKAFREKPELAAAAKTTLAGAKGSLAKVAAVALAPSASKGSKSTSKAPPILASPPRTTNARDKLPKLPDFFQPEVLPSLGIPAEATANLATMLAFSSIDLPYLGLRDVKEALDASLLRQWSWALFETWLAVGAPPKEMWILRQLAHFGDDDTVRRLVPLVRSWPGEHAATRAVEGLAVIGAIGGDLALMSLSDIADRVKFASIKEAATSIIERVASSRGLSRDDLGDRLVPDLGLDPKTGTRILDFGPRRFTVSFDEALVPRVRDEKASSRSGVLADLPKPIKSDDAAKAKLAAQIWKALKKDAKAIASSRIFRLEMAMIAKRRWSHAEWRMLFVDKPLVRQLSRGLVWGVYATTKTKNKKTSREKTLFRLAEDGTLADRNDDLFNVGTTGDIQIGIPHTLDLSEDDQRVFGRLFSEYEIIQPFEQLGRATFAPTKDDRKAKALESLRGIALPAPTLVFGLEKRRWERWGASDGGGFNGHSKQFGAVSAHVTYEGAVAMTYIDKGEMLTIDTVKFGSSHGKSGDLISEIDPIIVSEVIRDVRGLTA